MTYRYSLPSFWRTFEELPDLNAVPLVWQQMLEPHFAAFQKICLEPLDWLPSVYPCPIDCGCWHEIVASTLPPANSRPEDYPQPTIRAFCRCDPPECPELHLTLADIIPLQANRARLARALCQALGLESKPADLGLPLSPQIGAWSANAIPVILTIHYDTLAFRADVAYLVAQLAQPFILLTPTAVHIDAHIQSLISRVRAGLFTLDSLLTVSPDGTLSPLRPPADLFAQFSPQSINPSIHQSTNPILRAGPRYSIRKGRRVWHVTFDYEPAEFLHEQGAFYVAHLFLYPPPEPIHALDLIAKIPELYRQQLGLAQIIDPNTGKPVTLQSHARLQERNLALDDNEAMGALHRKRNELQAILDSEDECEPVKAEALRELDAIYQFEREHGRRSPDSAHSTAHAIRMAMTRVHNHLATALDSHGNPHPVLRPLADHIKKHILIPSSRYSGHGNRYARSGLAGCFTYEPPPGVSWTTPSAPQTPR